MPASALFSATIERLINQMLSMDPDSAARLKPLAGSRFVIFVTPLPFGIELHFSDRVDVLTTQQPRDVLIASLTAADCCIQTSLDTLPTLKDTSQLTRLIQEKKLNLDGELRIAQQVSALFQQLDIDWEEHLAEHTNDVLAHEVFSAGKRMHNTLLTFTRKLSRTVGNAVVEEKQLAAHRLAVMHFNDEVSELRDDVARAEVRLQKLEEQANKN